MKIQRLSPPRPGRLPIGFGQATVVFVACAMDGRPTMVGELDDAHPGALPVRRKVLSMPRHYRLLDSRDEAALEDLEAAALPKETLDGAVPAPVAAALRNGWTEPDLQGTGTYGDWGPEGGRSDRTGLTMAEMALCAAPGGWPDMAPGSAWPWELRTFRGPAADWKPPGLPARLQRIGDSPTVPEEPAGPDAALPGVDDGSVDAMTEPQVPSGTAGDAEALDAAVIARYGTDEQRQVAVVILADLWRDLGGKLPTRSKANHHLRKAELPTAATASIYDVLSRAALALVQE